MKNNRNGCGDRGLWMLRTVVCAGLLFCVCAPIPTQFSTGSYSVRLGLEDGTKTTATFSGQPIAADITLPESTYFVDIAWHLGSGQYRHPNVSPDKKIKQVQVELSWTTTPTCWDTARKQFYDSIYVSIAGETQRSNRVTVYVTNVPPTVDSLKIGSVVDKVDDSVRYSLTLSDTTSHLVMRLGVHDINHDTLRYDWYSSREGSSLDPLAQISYTIPTIQFFDTITATVYDGKGGSAVRVIFLSKVGKSLPPSIDSVTAGMSVFPGTDTLMYRFVSTVLDTVKFRVYATDPNAADTVGFSWTNTNAKHETVHPTGTGTTVLWIGDASLRTALPRDSFRVIDTIIVVARDERGDSVRRSIQIVQGRAGQPPQIDSVKLDSTTALAGTSMLVIDSLSFGDSVRIKPFFSDPDSDTVSWTYSAARPLQYHKNADSSLEYTSKDSLISDTLVITAKDGAIDSVKKTIVFATTNRYPIIDSIVVRDSVGGTSSTFKTQDSIRVVADTAWLGDTLSIKVAAHDPDLGDTVAVAWTSTKLPVVKKDAKGLFVWYECVDSLLYDDTLTVRITDKKQKSVWSSVVLHVKSARRIVHTPPKLDSMWINRTATEVFGGSAYLDSIVSVRDTLMLRVFTSDVDKSDSVKTFASSKFAGRLSKLADTLFSYIAKDSLYTDTVLLSAKDLKGDSAKGSFILKVTNRYPIVDSILVTDALQLKVDTLFKSADTVYSVKDSAQSNDTVKIQLYAHDPDKASGDSVASIVWSAKTGNALAATNVKGDIVHYVCLGQAYSDTITVRIADRRQKSSFKQIILNTRK
jgi:hypothetical protein